MTSSTMLRLALHLFIIGRKTLMYRTTRVIEPRRCATVRGRLMPVADAEGTEPAPLPGLTPSRYSWSVPHQCQPRPVAIFICPRPHTYAKQRPITASHSSLHDMLAIISSRYQYGPFLFFVVAEVMSNYLTADGLEKNLSTSGGLPEA